MAQDLLSNYPTEDAPLRARIRTERARVALQRQAWDDALQHLEQALVDDPLDGDRLVILAEALLRLSRLEEAIDALHLALRLAPHCEAAHYLLGNGYSPIDYDELERRHPQAFARGEDAEALQHALEELAQGNGQIARGRLLRLVRSNPHLADARMVLGSLAFVDGRHGAARRAFAAALRRCPGYGRAHNGLAKALEAQRLALDVHRPHHDQVFAAADSPPLEGLEELVLNWPSLSPRHQRRVALSVAPWGRFLEVLVESGATCTVKPLHLRLSECPRQGPLRNRRISYDGRLWDDVRGCGGYHSVTGIEDIERSIYGGYDTFLHELTHQVHYLLPAERKRELEDHYRRALARKGAGEDAFVSRYAGTNVWEYLAEGAHALARPRRDAHDSREVVAERLEARDPELVALVGRLQQGDDAHGARAVGQAHRAQDHLRRNEVAEALEISRLARDTAPQEESVVDAWLHSLTLAGHIAEALEAAREAAHAAPQSGTLQLRLANLLWLGSPRPNGLTESLRHLTEAREAVRPQDHREVDLRLATLHWIAGQAQASQQAAERLLQTLPEDPLGHWYLARALALAGDLQTAESHYARARRQRSGLATLRADHLHDLLRAGHLPEARQALPELQLLEPQEPRVLALAAWLHLAEGQSREAQALLDQALDLASWCDLVHLIAARTHPDNAHHHLAPLHQRVQEGTPPSYLYRPERSVHQLIHVLPSVELELLDHSPSR